MLLVGLGRVTRLLRFLTDLPKEYTATVVLGTATSTLDASGDVTGEWDMSHVTLDEARSAAAQLTGDILQVPPMVSALKVGGKRLHDLARQGIEVEREARPVTVSRFDIAAGPEAGTLAVDVRCSSGTYVRTLAADLGMLLGGGAHLRDLRRTAIGSFRVEDAVPLDALDAAHARSPVDALRDYPLVEVDADAARDVSHGKRIEVPAGVVRVVHDGQLIAMFEDGRPAVVLAAQ